MDGERQQLDLTYAGVQMDESSRSSFCRWNVLARQKTRKLSLRFVQLTRSSVCCHWHTDSCRLGFMIHWNSLSTINPGIKTNRSIKSKNGRITIFTHVQYPTTRHNINATDLFLLNTEPKTKDSACRDRVSKTCCYRKRSPPTCNIHTTRARGLNKIMRTSTRRLNW